MNVYVYGGGPTGLFISYYLAKNNNKVYLIEKENKLGGCWKQEFIDNKYFSEHSPRVLTNNNYIFDFLKDINFNYKLKNIYGNTFETNILFMKFFINNLSFTEIFTLIKSKLINDYNDLTVEEYFNKHNFSNKGKKALTVFSIALANSPSKLLMSELLNTAGGGLLMFYHFTSNEEWIDHVENELIKLNVTIYKNTEPIEFIENNNNITKSVLSNDVELNDGIHILTLPPIAFGNLLKTQSTSIQNNWMDYNKFIDWVDMSSYISLGFQFHFTEEINIKNKSWCWSCMDEYNLIILPVSDYLDEFTKDSNIKTVWSCTIVDPSVFINSVNKTVNEMTKDEIIEDITDKLNIEPFKVTFYDGTNKINNRWISKDSAFSTSKMGIIKPKGNIENLYTVGPHNMTGITTISKAIESGINFLNSMNIKSINKHIKYNILFIIIVIWIILNFLE